MRYTTDSILAFTPDNTGWAARFEATHSDHDNHAWYEPVIGWAVVVTWAAHEDKHSADTEDTHETSVLAVVLDEGSPSTTDRYVKDRNNEVRLAYLIPPGGRT